MRYKYKHRLFPTCLVVVAFMLAGCATSSSSLRFTQPEVSLIPAVAMHKALSLDSSNVAVVVRAESLPGLVQVTGFEGKDRVVVRDEEGKETKLAINELSEIYRITQFNRPTDSAGRKQGGTAAAVGEAMVYAPLIPVAVVSWPALRAMGLDEKKNTNDREKALLIYGGMTKQDLREAVGEPDKQYRCHRKDSPDWFYVWGYEKDRVLRAGQFLFFSRDDGKVYFSSFRYPSWAICEPSAQ